MDYGEVLSRAWQIIWKHKALWIFGILAGCGASSNSGNLSYSFSRNDASPWAQDFALQFERIPDWQIAALIGVSILVVLVLVVLVIFLSTVGRIGVIQGVKQAERGEARLAFGGLFRSSLHYFWRVFFLNLLFGLAVFAVVIVLLLLFIPAAILIGALTLGLAFLCLIPLACLIVPLSWLVSVYLEQANIAIVVDDLGIMDGLRRGWQVFSKNLGPMIVMGLILIVGISLIGGLIIGAPMFLIAVPALGGLLVGSENALWGGLLVAGLCFVAYLPILILANGILTSYVKSAWTLTYMRLTGRPATLAPVVVEVDAA